MRHRHAVTEDRNFPRTGEGHRNVRPSVARGLLVADFDGEPTEVTTDAELWEAERLIEEAGELLACAEWDTLRDCCLDCARIEVGARKAAREAERLVQAYYYA